MSENKVQFNLKNVHYAKATVTVSGGATSYSYATPVAVPGAVNLSLSAAGDTNKFFADGIVYYQSFSNQGYEGDLEIARVPDAMFKDIWGLTEGATSKVLTEKANVEAAQAALLFQIDGDSSEQLYVLYLCNFGRPDIASATNTESKEPQTMSVAISAVPRADMKVFARTTDSTPTATVTGWFSSVFEES